MSVTQVAFFVARIVLYAAILESHPKADLLIRFNPLFYLLRILRASSLGTPLTTNIVLKAVIVSAVILGISAVGLAHTCGRIAYRV